MKRILGIGIALIAIMVIASMPASSYAFNSLLELDLGGGSGDYTSAGPSGSIDTGSIGMAYTRYLTPLETTDAPYAMREFLQHPTYLNVRLQSQTMDTNLSGGAVTTKDAGGTFSIGGMYYLPNGTGLGATYVSSSHEEERKQAGVINGKDEITEASLVVSINHYPTDTLSYGLDFTSLKGETTNMAGATVDHTQRTLEFKASSLINRMVWVSGKLGFGEREYDQGASLDLNRVELEAGVAPFQKLGIIVGVARETLEKDIYEDKTTSTMLALDYSVSESLNVKTAVIRHKRVEDDNGSVTETDINAIKFSVGILF